MKVAQATAAAAQLLPDGAERSVLLGGSLRDVQSLTRRSSLQMIQRCIEINEDAMKRVVG